MKFGKKLISSLAVAAISVSMVATGAFAAYSSTPATGYGTLSGAISMNYSLGDFYLTTNVTQNNDNAYLTGNVEWQSQTGATEGTGTAVPSSRGATSLFDFWTLFGAQSYQAFGTHGVQGGSTYSAKAVYTYTLL
ncbi:hypothetical protein ACX1C1_08650 [Paenibacillus sp. strain BS8-2]